MAAVKEGHSYTPQGNPPGQALTLPQIIKAFEEMTDSDLQHHSDCKMCFEKAMAQTTVILHTLTY
jgi:hypothetical protein